MSVNGHAVVTAESELLVQARRDERAGTTFSIPLDGSGELAYEIKHSDANAQPRIWESKLRERRGRRGRGSPGSRGLRGHQFLRQDNKRLWIDANEDYSDERYNHGRFECRR